MELNFEDLEMQKWNLPTDRAQIVDGKNGVICLAIMFTPQVMVFKMLKMTHFLYLLLMPAKNQKTLSNSLRKCYELLYSELPLARNQPLKIQSFIILYWLSSFLYFYPRYLTNGNCKTYEPSHFLKELKNIF